MCRDSFFEGFFHTLARRHTPLGALATAAKDALDSNRKGWPRACPCDGKQLGRRPVEQSQARMVKAALALRSQGIGIRRIAREVGLGVGTVLRIVSRQEA
jgi:Helix-turn-helix domain of resolvase